MEITADSFADPSADAAAAPARTATPPSDAPPPLPPPLAGEPGTSATAAPLAARAAPPSPWTPAGRVPAATSPAAPASTPRPPATLLEQLVRALGAFLDRVADPGPEAAHLVRVLVLTVALGAALFGAVIGSFRGGRQVLYCAAKLPLVLVGTLVVCAPAFVAFARAFGARTTAREVITLSLGAAARFALVLAGLAPVVWLTLGWVGYHGVILVIVAACAVAGLAAAALLFRGLWRAGGVLAGGAFVLLFALVGGHTAWMLRPFVVRPQTREVPFVRAVEGALLHSVRSSARSAAGIYDLTDTQQERGFPGGAATAGTAGVASPEQHSGERVRSNCAAGEPSCD